MVLYSPSGRQKVNKNTTLRAADAKARPISLKAGVGRKNVAAWILKVR